MRRFIPGLLLGLCVVLLMLGAMVSFPAEEAPTPLPPLPAAPCAVCPAEANRLPEEGPARQAEGPRFGKAQAAPVSFEQSLPASPSADANGVPLLRVTYRRSNYRAFHYSDEAG